LAKGPSRLRIKKRPQAIEGARVRVGVVDGSGEAHPKDGGQVCLK
jgi:hypothetical protein